MGFKWGSARPETEMSASARQLPVADSVGDDSWQGVLRFWFRVLGLGFRFWGFRVCGRGSTAYPEAQKAHVVVGLLAQRSTTPKPQTSLNPKP